MDMNLDDFTMTNEDVADLMFHAAVDAFFTYEEDYPSLDYDTALQILAKDLAEICKRRYGDEQNICSTRTAKKFLKKLLTNF